MINLIADLPIFSTFKQLSHMKNALFTLLSVFFLISCNKKIEENLTPATDDFPLSQSAINDFTQLTVPMKQQEPLKLTDDELRYFDDLSRAQVVGLGEATHGTKEFFQMKHRLFKYFVEHFNHKVFAFEMDFSEALIFDEYVQTGKGDIEKLMKEKMFFWTWNTSEVKDLLVWMKDYNIGKAEKDRVHIYGIDCQTFKYNVPELIKRVSAIDSKMGQDIAALLTDLALGKFEGKKANILTVNNLIKDSKLSLVAKSSALEYDFIEHISNIIVQTETILSDKNESTVYTNRDLFMGENAVWLKKHTDFPMSVWAHNLHIKNAESSNVIDRAMGYHINNKLQGGYMTVGFSFTEGSVTAVNSETQKLGYFTFAENITSGYSNELFSKMNTPNFFYRTPNVYRNTYFKEFFTKKSFYQIGAAFYPSAAAQAKVSFPPLLEENFLYMIHISKTSHSNNYLVN